MNLSIDTDIVIRCKTSNMNISNLVNNFLRNALAFRESDKEANVLQQEIDSLSKDIQVRQTKIAELSADLAMVQEKSVREKAEEDERMALLYRAARHNNPLRDVL